MTTFSDAPSIAAEDRRSGSLRLVIGPTHVGEIDRPVDNRDGVAADPDVVVALYMHAAGAAQTLSNSRPPVPKRQGSDFGFETN